MFSESEMSLLQAQSVPQKWKHNDHCSCHIAGCMQTANAHRCHNIVIEL